VLPNEKQTNTVGFVIRVVTWFGRQGIECRRVLKVSHGLGGPNPLSAARSCEGY
jgi:hypothetical protein